MKNPPPTLRQDPAAWASGDPRPEVLFEQALGG